MLKQVHESMLTKAVGDKFSRRALDVIMAANFSVDSPLNILFHREYHFDDNAFAESLAFIDSQRALIEPALERGDAKAAWEAFGRLTHTAQDFYSHSNYVDLWLATQPHGMVPGPKEIDPLDDALVDNPSLRSAKMYWPVVLLTVIPVIKNLVIPRMPPDSHTHMNLDSEERGPMFMYAFHAAVKRTQVEFETVMKRLTRDQRQLFSDIA